MLKKLGGKSPKSAKDVEKKKKDDAKKEKKKKEKGEKKVKKPKKEKTEKPRKGSSASSSPTNSPGLGGSAVPPAVPVGEKPAIKGKGVASGIVAKTAAASVKAVQENVDPNTPEAILEAIKSGDSLDGLQRYFELKHYGISLF